MPTYDLECQDCGERFERFVLRLLREDDKVCPCCQSSKVKTGFGGGVLGSGTTMSKTTGSCGSGAFS